MKAIENVLRDRYGFNVKTLVNATRVRNVHRAERAHDEVDREATTSSSTTRATAKSIRDAEASWLPVDADPKNDVNWISSDDLTRKIGR